MLVGSQRRTLGARLAMVAPCSVAVLPDERPSPLTHVIVAFDFSLAAAETSSWPTRLVAADPIIRCTALHVITHECTDLFAGHETDKAQGAEMVRILEAANVHGVAITCWVARRPPAPSRRVDAMITRPDLRLLFATDLSEASLRASGALSALAARCCIDVAFVHVTTPDGRSRADDALNAFVSRVHPDYACRPLLLEGRDPVDAVNELCARARFDLVVAPPSERPSLAGVGSTSFRARLLRRGQVPLWSGGHGVDLAHAGQDIGAVGCVVDLNDLPQRHLRHAWAFAKRMSARLHVVSTVPAIDDGTIARLSPSDPPLTPAEASAWIRRLLPGAAFASLEVTTDDGRTRLHRRMAAHHPDVVFVGRQHWASALWPARYPRFLDRLAYPVICLSPAPTESAWSFEDASTWIGANKATEALAGAG